jgi:hypothetical protein
MVNWMLQYAPYIVWSFTFLIHVIQLWMYHQCDSTKSAENNSVNSITWISYPYTGQDRPLRLQKVEVSVITSHSTHGGDKVVSLTYWPPWTAPQETSLVLISGWWRMCRCQGHSVARRIKSMKNHNDPFRNWTCILPACSTVPQLTALPCTPTWIKLVTISHVSQQQDSDGIN